MLFIAAIFLAASAAAVQENTPMFSQKELVHMPINAAQQQCGNNMDLVCCEHGSDDCARIDIPNDIKGANLLIDHCNAQVFCCDIHAPINGGKIEGNVYNTCIAIGNASH